METSGFESLLMGHAWPQQRPPGGGFLLPVWTIGTDTSSLLNFHLHSEGDEMQIGCVELQFFRIEHRRPPWFSSAPATLVGIQEPERLVRQALR
ncbi:MAG: hypothetical protein AB7S86_19100 [Hydrogenophaga sp.]|uniref:hypothetical protein n=1 Tax=Hydrogenophaga sp. TaxID=1904254 RepID=UPI003D147F09